jgi:hypothetical protein
MELKIVVVKGGFHARGSGAGREVVGFGRTREDAKAALAVVQERSFRLQQIADGRKAKGT